MFRDLTTALVGLLALSIVIGGSTKGSVKNAEILKMLEKADLKGHGFQKEVSRGVLSTGTVTTLFYYKVVDCSRVMQVMIEVQKLLPGTLVSSVDAMVVKEAKIKNIQTMQECKAGFKINLEPDPYQVSDSTLSRVKREPKDCSCTCNCRHRRV